MPKNKSDPADLVRDIRAKWSYTQEQLAKLLGVDACTVSRWERRKFKPHKNSLERLEAIKKHG